MPVLALFLLLTHPALALDGAGRGLLLWSRTVLPTLLPFMICSNVIVAAGGLPFLTAPLRPILRGVLGLSDAGGYVLISGLLCGYPMGAKTCGEFLTQGRISDDEARYLLAISNHPSPMFVLGYLASGLSPQIPVWLVMTALYLPVLPLSFLARQIYRCAPRPVRAAEKHLRSGSVRPLPSNTDRSSPAPCRRENTSRTSPAACGAFDAIMMRSIEVMVRIGGYIMLFSILAAFIGDLPLSSAPLKALALGAAEITTGIRAISQAMDGFPQGLCLTAVTAFGGLSGIFQTRSVLPPAPKQKNAGLSIRHYILWKLLHMITSCLLYSLLYTAVRHFRLPPP